MTQPTLLYLSREDVEAVDLPMADIVAALEEMFREKGQGNVEMPPKPGIHTRPDAFIHAMPAYIPSLEAAGMKWVSGYPGNQARGLPYITGLLVLNDPLTGIPLAVMDATWITAMRTGAATALAARYLARPDSSTVAVLGCGVQGRSNAHALATLFELKKVRAFDPHPERVREYARDIQDQLGLEVVPAADPRDALQGADLVVTAGPILKNPDPAIAADWLEPGGFASAVDFDSYWQGAALEQADKIATDDLAQMEYYRGEGYFGQTPPAYADMGELAAGLKPGREREDERIIAMNLGIALEDMAAGIRVYRAAVEGGIGTRLPL